MSGMSGQGLSQGQSSPHGGGPLAFLKMAWSSGCCTLMVVLLFYIAGYAVMSPYLPNLLTDFFASKIHGSPIRCEEFPPTKLPDACLQGSAANVQWQSVTSFFTNSILVFLLAPLTGVWSDMVGRKPFLVLSQFLSIASKIVVLLHVFSGASLYSYYVVGVIDGAVSPIVVTLAAVADVVPPRHRAAMFSITLGTFSAGIAVTPKLGIALGLKKAVALGVLLKALGILYTIVFVRETVTPAARECARLAAAEHAEHARQASSSLDEALRAPNAPPATAVDVLAQAGHACMQIPAIRLTVTGLSVIVRNSEFIKLAAALMVASFVQAGLFDIESQYLLTLFGFDQEDFALVFMAVGAGMLVVQVLLMPALLALLSERAMILAAFVGTLVKLTGLSMASEKWQCFASIFAGSLYFMAFPAISSIKANAVPEHEQGSVQGAVAGVQALASGCGPLLFMALYNGFIQTDTPRLVMVVGICVSVVPMVLICFLDLQKLQSWKERNLPLAAASSSSGRVEEPLLPKAAEAGAMHGLTGHDILVEDAAMGHWEASATAPFAVQAGLLAPPAAPEQGGAGNAC